MVHIKPCGLSQREQYERLYSAWRNLKTSMNEAGIDSDDCYELALLTCLSHELGIDTRIAWRVESTIHQKKMDQYWRYINSDKWIRFDHLRGITSIPF